jgi:RNA polymerase sigma-70 factor (ECF subfamily)
MSTQELSLPLPGQAGLEPDAAADALFENVAQEYAAPLARLARAHEADPALQQDLLQEIHLALWRSLPAFQNRCSLRTWVYRVAHNVAATHVVRARRRRTSQLVNLDDVEIADDSADFGTTVDEARALARVAQLIQRLKPIDRQVIILHLEGLSRDDIAEIAGLSFSNVAIKIHRIKLLLTRAFGPGHGAQEKS